MNEVKPRSVAARHCGDRFSDDPNSGLNER
jgi:hypothetical protein